MTDFDRVIEAVQLGRLTVGDINDEPIVMGARCRLDLPYARPPKELGGNARVHWRPEAKAKAALRGDVATLARAAGLHRIPAGRVEHVTVALFWAPGDHRKRDEDNLWKMLKIGCDALARGRGDLVGLDLVPDDSPEHMTKLRPRILPPPEPKGMWLDITLRFRQDGAA